MKSFKMLEQLSANLSNLYPEAIKENKAWAESKFDWMRTLPPARKGAIGRDLASGLLQSYGLTCTSSRYLLRVNGQGISVKTSLMWGAGVIKFQNIRNTDYDFILCQGIYPTTSYGWLIPKKEIWVNGKLQSRLRLTGQHGGKTGDDAWIGIDPQDPPAWIKKYGGTTDELLAIIKTEL
jgi:hypothetical protein